VDADAWNARYDTDELVWRAEPNQFLPPEVAALRVGRALDLACGEGRNSVWLAQQGWEVTGVDFSHVAVAKGRRLADDRGVGVTWGVHDLTRWSPPEAAFELVIVFYLQLPAAERRTALVSGARALAPGGTFLLVAHDLDNLRRGVGGPQDPEVLVSPDAVVADLAAASVADLEIARAERVERAVVTDAGEATAIDCLVRATRSTRA
jgi:SAM-dependent methyltransferase